MNDEPWEVENGSLQRRYSLIVGPALLSESFSSSTEVLNKMRSDAFAISAALEMQIALQNLLDFLDHPSLDADETIP
tara:strand:+ start:67212 stop:67442 length:231 start_codon:yes stop_codon:yes gene_type:complete